jgi:hypothetical protein
VAKALNKLGVPSGKDINALIHRIDELNKSVQKLSAKSAPAVVKKVTKPAAKPVAKPPAKVAAKRAAPRKTAKATPAETSV